MPSQRWDSVTASTSAWIASLTRQPITAKERLNTGASSAVTRLELADGSAVVLREILDRAWLARKPQLISREADALSLLDDSVVPVPRLLGMIPGQGLLLASWIDGRVAVQAEDLRARVGALAEATAAIASIELPARAGFPDWRSWVPTEVLVPAMADQSLWTRAVEAYRRATMPQPRRQVLLHRDLHPLNVLWQDEAVVGVVDWVNASVGHPHAELGNTRWNLAVLAGPAAAEEYLQAVLDATRSSGYSGYWDLEAALGRTTDPIDTRYWHSVGRPDIDEQAMLDASEYMLESGLRRI